MQISASSRFTVPPPSKCSPLAGSFVFFDSCAPRRSVTANVRPRLTTAIALKMFFIFLLCSPLFQNSTTNCQPASDRIPVAIHAWKKGPSPATVSPVETAVQSFSRPALLETEAHLSFHHHAHFGARGNARSDGANSRDLSHDGLRSRAAPEGDRFRRAHPGHNRRHPARLALAYG